jgi:3-hydroxyacyl-CoA dehydrogenase/3a,7a,12a-trihydroxy-5b-cholest-24-enoyl-CoA hydratase
MWVNRLVSKKILHTRSFQNKAMNRLLRFDGRVAVVTGAGGGLGRSYALLLAERGASVVVNDLGGTTRGEGKDTRAADLVVEEIVRKGGKAVPNYDSVTDGEGIIKTALDNFGRIDILINNAGILRDKSFAKMGNADWDLIQQVHVQGAYKTTRAAWEHFKNQKYGRIIMTSSAAGIFGNFGQANYSTAKSSLLGFGQTLAREGAKLNVFTNIIAPVAGSRMTEYILPPDLHAALKPELIAPVVAWLCHEECQDNGSIIEAAAGLAAKYQWFRTRGALLRNRLDENVTIEGVRDKWNEVVDADKDKGELTTTVEESISKIMSGLEKMESGTNISPQEVTRFNLVDYAIPDCTFKYETKDAILYALAVGMSTEDEEGLNYLYENSENFRVLPTFPVIAGFDAMFEVFKLSGLNVDFTKILHGEQFVQLHRPLPMSGNIKIKSKVVDVLDKISGALYIVRSEGEDQDGPIFTMEYNIFEVGAGKFGGKRDTDKPISRPITCPQRPPDQVFEYKTAPAQAALYRLCGDSNPLHIDPDFAAMGGFSRPILHGLCFFGITARLILKHYANADPRHFKAIKTRFAKPVYPGETLQILTWQERTRIHYEVKVKETGVTVLSGGYVDLADTASIRQKSKI